MTPPKNPKKKTPDSASSSLTEEIRLLRGILRQVAELSGDGQPPADQLDVLRTVGEASTRLATLIKAQHELAPSADLPSVLNQVLARIKAEREQQNAAAAKKPGQQAERSGQENDQGKIQ